jgi:uncharacterized protein (TIGR02466 family)
MIHQLFSKSILTAELGREFSDFERTTFKNADYVLDSAKISEEPTNIAFTTEVNILKSLNLVDIEAFIMQNVNDYMFKELEVVDPVTFFIARSWLVKSLPSGFARRHNHPNSIVSGVLYLETVPTSGNFILHDHQNSKFGSVEFSYNLKPNNCSYVSIPPKPGMLIMFPSTMQHEVGINRSEQERYSLSFDVWFNGAIGTRKSHIVLPA